MDTILYKLNFKGRRYEGNRRDEKAGRRSCFEMLHSLRGLRKLASERVKSVVPAYHEARQTRMKPTNAIGENIEADSTFCGLSSPTPSIQTPRTLDAEIYGFLFNLNSHKFTVLCCYSALRFSISLPCYSIDIRTVPTHSIYQNPCLHRIAQHFRTTSPF